MLPVCSSTLQRSLKKLIFFRHDGIHGFMLYTLQPGSSRNGAFLSEEARCGGPLGRTPLLGTLEDMLRKAPDTGLSLHWGPFMSEGNLESGGGGPRIPGTLNDEWRALRTGFLSPRRLHEEDLEGGFLYWGPRNIW